MITEAYEALCANDLSRVNRVELYKEVIAVSPKLTMQRHPLGFIHIELTSLVPVGAGERLRLHIWDTDAGVVDDLGDLHDHVWALHSLVLDGELTDSTYEAIADAQGPFWGSRVKYGALNSSEPDARYRLDLLDRRRISAGTVYRIPSGVIHASQVTKVPSVTLLLAVDDPHRKERGPLVLSRVGAHGHATAARPAVSVGELEAALLPLIR